MSLWDRKALLLLVDEAGRRLGDSTLSMAQRQSLQGLLSQFGDKAKSIHACHLDVLSMQSQLRKIVGSGNTES